MSTSVIEGLNIGDVVTADRVVAQIATEHPSVGYVPSISFLGTHFENLRIAGHSIDLQLDLNIVGEKPENDVPYLSHPGFLGRVQRQSERLSSLTRQSNFSSARYTGTPTTIDGGQAIDFSLVHQLSGDIHGFAFGHIIDVPNFGTVHLATARLSQKYQNGSPQATTVKLTMAETQTANDGTTSSGTTVTNGRTKP